MIKYIGAGVIFLLSFYLSSEHRRYSRRRLLEGEASLAFMKALRRDLGCFLRPISEWAQDYEDSVFMESGFLSLLREGASLGEAYRISEPNFNMSEAAKKSLSSFCAAFGRGYLEDELRLADAHIAELEASLAAERTNTPKSCRLVGTLAAAGSFAIVILLI